MYTVKLPDGGEVRHDIRIPFSIDVHPSVKSFSLSGFPTYVDFPPGMKSYTHSNGLISITYYNPQYYKKDEPKESASSSEKTPKPKADDRLLLAVDKCDLEAIRSLLESGLDPNGIDDKGHTPLYHAVSKNRIDIVFFLLEHGADPTIDYLSMERVVQKQTIRKLLIAAKESPRNILGATDEYGYTLLHCAVVDGNVDDVRFLLAKGANPNSQNHNRETPLNTALRPSRYGDREACAKLLIKKGARIDVTDSDGNTLLHHAVRFGVRWCVDLLLKKVPKFLNAVNRDGDSPLDLCNNPEIKAKLKAAGAKHRQNILVRGLRKLDKLDNL